MAGLCGPVLLAVLFCVSAVACADDEKALAMITRYTATWDIDEFLAEDDIQSELALLAGSEITTLRNNLSVTGGMEYYGGSLTARGNAPHQGTEEEAIICVQPWSEKPRVHAAIYTSMQVLIYTREVSYSSLPTCIKDWITGVNSGHVDRQVQPGNVQVLSP